MNTSRKDALPARRRAHDDRSPVKLVYASANARFGCPPILCLLRRWAVPLACLTAWFATFGWGLGMSIERRIADGAGVHALTAELLCGEIRFQSYWLNPDTRPGVAGRPPGLHIGVFDYPRLKSGLGSSFRNAAPAFDELGIQYWATALSTVNPPMQYHRWGLRVPPWVVLGAPLVLGVLVKARRRWFGVSGAGRGRPESRA
jgi:hypothetical protein